MPESADQIYKTQADIVSDILASVTSRIPDANVGPDSIWRIWAEVYANTAEGLYLAMQLLHDDMFIQTANALALIRSGEMFGRPRKSGTFATGEVRFSGVGGTFVPVGTIVSVPRPATEDSLDFVTTADGTIPNPGLPDAPLSAAGAAGALTGTFEWAATFLTADGETELGDASIALVLAAKHASLTNIPLGGPGTTERNIYRRDDGGDWLFIATLADNTTTIYDDNDNTPGPGSPPDVSTAEELTLAVQANEVGSDFNVAMGTITDLSDAPPDLTDVINDSGCTGGIDAEDIEVFRSALLKWVRAPQSGSPQDLEVWAEAIDGVESATAFPNEDLAGTPTPGTTAVRISGPGGSAPGSDVIDAVQAALDARDLANITVIVGDFDAHPVAVSVTITTDAGYNVSDVTPSVEQAITDYLASVPIGGTVYVAGIYAAIFGLAGVATLVVTAPGADVVLGSTEKATAGALTVS